MKLYELAKSRKTVRKFDKSRIPDLENIKYAIDVAKEAPSGKNDQPWLYVLIQDEKQKMK
nr:nitroreductase family protein [Marinitoga lauensis]